MDNPQLAEIVRILPVDTVYQTVRTAAKLDLDAADVITAVANAVTHGARSPKGQEPALRVALARPAVHGPSTGGRADIAGTR